jgi:predicted NAD/FAD-binding protein
MAYAGGFAPTAQFSEGRDGVLARPAPRDARPRVAVVGSGISGLASAWLLRHRYAVTLFEALPRLGGHTNTVDVELEGRCHPVDTGFLVYNRRTYPHLIALFAELGIESVESDMSFSVSLTEPELEWAGTSLATVFAQKRNLLRGRFWRMLADLLRFNRQAQRWLARGEPSALSLGEFLDRHGYSRAFADWYLLPMAAAIWSCPAQQMRQMPLASFLRFCSNHGLLQVADHPRWRTVKGGARQYVNAMAAALDDVRLACPVHGVVREGGTLKLTHAAGVESFDHVVMACHSDTSLQLLGATASAAQAAVLAAVRYQPNEAWLHTDPALLPRDRRLWSAWNYLCADREQDRGQRPVAVSYLINQLQPLPFTRPVIVTLNPARPPAAEHRLARFEYMHPVLDAAATAAQAALPAVQGEGGIWLAGAWGRYGFHEDGLMSALAVANGLGVQAPWQSIQSQQRAATA